MVDKPAGILCLPSEEGVPSIVETVFEYVQQQQQKTTKEKETGTANTTATNATTATMKNEYDPLTSERVHAMDQMIVHRLGYDTAGLLVLAKTIPAVRALNILFRTRPSIPSVPANTIKMNATTINTSEENRSNATVTTERNHSDGELFPQQNVVAITDTDDSMADITIAERLNQMGIVRQYEVLVAGHVQPQIKTKTINTTHQDTTPSTNSVPNIIAGMTPTPLGSGWIHLPLMRCYEYPPYMRVSTPTQQQYLLSLDSTIVGKKLLEAPKASVTYYEIIKYDYYQNNTSLPVTRMTLTSMTGRTHQLNVHCTYCVDIHICIFIFLSDEILSFSTIMNRICCCCCRDQCFYHSHPNASLFVGAAIGHPIVRDTVYGYNGSAAPFGGLSMEQLPNQHASLELQRAIHEVSALTTTTNTSTKMCVHAKVIRFKHPMTGVELEFTSTPSF